MPRKRKSMCIKGKKVEVEGDDFITLPYYTGTGEIDGVALIPMVSKRKYPYSVFEYLRDMHAKNPAYMPTRKDLEQFFYIQFPSAEEIARMTNLFPYNSDWMNLRRN